MRYKYFPRIVVACGLAIIVGCNAPESKEYSELEPIDSRVEVIPIWTAPIGNISVYHRKQLPATAFDGRVYVANAEGEVGVLEVSTGKLIWSNDLNVAIVAGPGVGQDLIVVTTDNAEIIALDRKSGSVRWRTTVSSIVIATPVINNGKVFVQSINAKLTALNAETGARIWVAERDIPALTLRGTAKPLVLVDKVITGFANGKLVAMNKATGKTLWETVVAVPNGRTDLERMVDIDGLIAVNGDVVYAVSYQGRIAAISTEDGNIIWTRDMSSYTGVSVAHKQLYVTDADGYVWALDLNTGATLWRQDQLKDRDISAPIVMGDLIVIGDGSGLIHWLSKDDGGLVAREDLERIHYIAYYDWVVDEEPEPDYAITADPQVANNTLFVRDNEGSLSVFRIKPK